ncbi:Nicotinic acid mononucleotide adenyltransferase [Tenacibaculum sp. 190524A05c]
MLMNKMIKDMKKVMILACGLLFAVVQGQEIKPKYQKEGDLIKVTHFHDNGTVKEQGYYKDKLLHGVWNRFDEKGNKTVMAHYNKGKKVGKWFIWTKDELKEINYQNNTIASVQSWKESTKIAIK